MKKKRFLCQKIFGFRENSLYGKILLSSKKLAGYETATLNHQTSMPFEYKPNSSPLLLKAPTQRVARKAEWQRSGGIGKRN